MAAVASSNGVHARGPTSPHSSQASSPTSPSFNGRGNTGFRPSTPSTAGGAVSLEAPSGVSYLDFVREWSDAHVAAWLTGFRCGALATTFAANDIRGDVVLDLDQNTLREMGIGSVGDRARVVNAVKQLRAKSHASKLLVTPRVTLEPPATQDQTPLARSNSKRGVSARPPPLTLKPAGTRTDLELVRGTPRPGVSTPNSAHGSTPINKERPSLPVPPPPRINPPQPPAGAQATTSKAASTPTVGQQLPPQQRQPSALSLPPQNARRPVTPEPPPYTNQPPPATPGGGWQPAGAIGLPSGPAAYRTTTNTPQSATRPIRTPQQASHSKTPSVSRVHPYATTLEAPTLKTVDLSPIAESFMSGSANTPSRLYAATNIITGRPGTPAGSNAGYSLDELRRKTVKFFLEDGGNNYRVVPVFDLERGVDILERVLKKFGKQVSSPIDPDFTPEGGLILDGFGVFYSQSLSDGRPLTDAQLLSVCRADPETPAREMGLYLRPAEPPQRMRTMTTASMEEIKKMNRASSISILSSLGVRDPERALLAADSPTSSKSPASPNSRIPQKLRNFFGQRPPSELIHNHVTDFFPNTDKRTLKRTQRNSILKQTVPPGRRDSRLRQDSSTKDWLPQPPSRFSTSTVGSRSRASMETMPRGGSPPPVPEKPDPSSPPRMELSLEDGDVVDITADDEEEVKQDPGELRPFPTMERRGSTSSRRSRMSFMSELRSKRDNSDTASMLTVEEITQEVESRRSSWIGGSSHDATVESGTYVDDDDDDSRSIVRKSTAGLSVPIAASDDDDEDEEEEEEEDEEDEVADDDDEDTLANDSDSSDDKPIKYIRGALIGSGSFGNVYLGMDKVSGTLMAVKQVELPSGSSHNEERKQSMLAALEREIDLLKELQHENIVQYLDSFMDKNHLNIFLEYVPGGSVTSLLNKFGAFEEVLVRTFVRQILQGLNYLHESGIIHRDIKGANMLVDNKGIIKISDFGISKRVADNILSSARLHRPSLQGSVFWMAPEVVKQTSYTLKADIWSLGCLIVEMLTGQHPYPKLNQMQAIFKIGQSAKPENPDEISADAEDFLNSTFEIEYEKRPSAAELLLRPWIVKNPANPTKKGPKPSIGDTSF